MSGRDILLRLILTFIRFHLGLPEYTVPLRGKCRLDAPDGQSSALGRIRPCSSRCFLYVGRHTL